MIHTSYSGSTYNTQEDISDASVLLNKFNTCRRWPGEGVGWLLSGTPLHLLGALQWPPRAEQHCQSQCNHHWRDMLNQLLLQLIWDPNHLQHSFELVHLILQSPGLRGGGAGDWTRD
eukprot:Em0024g237a